jgi:hypothetical protein
MLRTLAMTAMLGIATAGIAVVGLGASTLAIMPDDGEARTVTYTGWFSDIQCATPAVKRGEIKPNNPDCVKKCLEKGAAAVFISEQAKDLFEVKHYEGVKEDLGYHIELTGRVDPAAKTIDVQSVKRLEYVGSQCALPRKKKTD